MDDDDSNQPPITFEVLQRPTDRDLTLVVCNGETMVRARLTPKDALSLSLLLAFKAREQI